MTCLFWILHDRYESNLGLVLSLLKYLHDTDRDTREFPLPSRGLARHVGCTHAEAKGQVKKLVALGVIDQLRQVRGHATQYGLSAELVDLLQSVPQSGRQEGGPQGEKRGSPGAELVASSRGGSILADREYCISKRVSTGSCTGTGTRTPHSPLLSRSAENRPPFSSNLSDNIAAELHALSTCLPKIAWSRHVAGLRADGVPDKNILAALQLALHEALLGPRRVRSWGRWLRVTAKTPESVDEASRRTIDSWLAALEPLRARLAASGAPTNVEDAPGVRDALTALLEASEEDCARRALGTGQGTRGDVRGFQSVTRRVVAPHCGWEQVLRLYGGNSTLTFLDAGAPVPPTPVSLEYRLWAAYGVEALVRAKTDEMEELRDCGVEVVFPSVEEGSHGC